jgi:hypothetical protein
LMLELRSGSKAAVLGGLRDVRFTPESGHRLGTLGCPLCATSGLMHCNNFVVN